MNNTQVTENGFWAKAWNCTKKAATAVVKTAPKWGPIVLGGYIAKKIADASDSIQYKNAADLEVTQINKQLAQAQYDEWVRTHQPVQQAPAAPVAQPVQQAPAAPAAPVAPAGTPANAPTPATDK